MFTVFRHPVDRAISMFYYIQVADWEPSYRPELKDWTLKEYAESNICENNWMTRMLSNQPGGEVTEGNLQVAMEAVRTKILVGLTNQIEPSMARFEKFFRWKFRVDPSAQEESRRRYIMMEGGVGSNSNLENKREMPLPGDEAWEALAKQNKFDLKLYEYIEWLFEQQGSLVEGLADNYRNVGATCCKCDPPSFPVDGGSTCPESVKNGRRRLRSNDNDSGDFGDFRVFGEWDWPFI